MLAKIRTTVSEVADKIKGGEAIYAKAANNVATIWETLLKDGASEKIRQHIHEADKHIISMKVEIRKLPLQQKVLKHAEIKKSPT